jgi:hypothetical protein
MNESSESRIHVHTVILRYRVEGEDEDFELAFDLSGEHERRIGSICFDSDIDRARAFVKDPPRWEVDAVRGPAAAIPGLKGPRRVRGKGGQASARRIAVHEENTCDWIVIR